MTPDIDKVARIVAEVAAEEVVPRFRKLESGDVQEKTGPHDLVTAADLAAEEMLTRALKAELPGSLVVGEEAVAADAAVLDQLEDEGAVWVVDPVDGTLNFTEGRHEFMVMVALVRAGATVAGWIHEPLTGRTVMAEHGAGARDESGAMLRVARAEPIKRMVGALYIGKRRTPELYDRLQAVHDHLGPMRYSRCAGAEHTAMARGLLHYAVFTRLMPWDHAAGCLIHDEAGGVTRRFDGRPYAPRPMDGPLLLAPDAQSWAALRALFTGTRPEDAPRVSSG